MLTTPVLEIFDLKKTYHNQKRPALAGISFHVLPGEKIGIIGANGSGKTTLFKVILDLVKPDKGSIKILSENNPDIAKTHIGYVPEHQQGLHNFTPDELFTYAAKMYHMPSHLIEKRKRELIEWSGLSDNREELVENFSKGMMQRLQLALALLHQPKILLLDEPMSGLDPSGQNKIRLLLKELEDYTLLYASHNLADIEELCRRIIILRQGEIINDTKLSDLDEDVVTIESETDLFEFFNKYPDIKVKEVFRTSGFHKVVFTAKQANIQSLLTDCKNAGIEVSRIRTRTVLEDLFEKYVKSA